MDITHWSCGSRRTPEEVNVDAVSIIEPRGYWVMWKLNIATVLIGARMARVPTARARARAKENVSFAQGMSMRSRGSWIAHFMAAVPLALATSVLVWNVSRADDAPYGNVNQQRALAADADPGNWLLHGRTFSDQFFSPLQIIDKSNIQRLGVAWYTDANSPAGLVSQPLMVDGVIYYSGMYSSVTALDAGTGKKIWNFFPKNIKLSPKVTNRLAVWAFDINRGIAIWEGRVYVGTGDCRLIALNAKTGVAIWETQVCDVTKGYAITGAPRAAGGKVFIGTSGSDNDVRGFVAAFDTKTGTKMWDFYTVPAKINGKFESDFMALAARTWDEGMWSVGGAAVWNSITYDPDFNRLYLGTSCVGPLNPRVRNPSEGDELFECAIVALDADTGQYVWHYSVNPNFGWDYDATMPIVLAEIEFKGQKRKVLMQAPKNGFFFVLDRETGRFISAKNYTVVNWAKGYDAGGRPIFADEAKYWEKPDGTGTVFPSDVGSHSIQPMSFSPKTGLAYIPTCEFGSKFKLTTDGGAFGGIEVDIMNYKPGAPDTPKVLGRLVAWNPATQSEKWAFSYSSPCNGGVMSTAAGLVFQGDNYGVGRAFDAEGGKLLWSEPLGSSIESAPITYMYHGEQYILFLTGFGGAGRQMWPEFANAGPSRVVALKLGSTLKVPAFTNRQMDKPSVADTAYQKNPQEVALGEHLFQTRWCVLCHGMHARVPAGDSRFPDLRRMSRKTYDDFENIVLGGKRSEAGMYSYKDLLNRQEALAIRDYIIHQATADYASQEKDKKGNENSK
jgi:quinohemoprotein ethanol dehydrogenase